MPGGDQAYNAKDLRSALIQLEDIKDPTGDDSPRQHISRFKRIMVVTTVDQDLNRTIADTAYDMAEVVGGNVFLLSVLPSELEGAGLAAAQPMAMSTPLVATFNTHMREDRTQQLEALRDEIESGVETDIEVRTGLIENVIIDYAKECHADVIVVGSPNRSWLDVLLKPPVSRSVVRSAVCPVLVVPEAEVLAET